MSGIAEIPAAIQADEGAGSAFNQGETMRSLQFFDFGKLIGLADQSNGKVFLHDALGLTICEVSINAVSKWGKTPFVHSHKQNEEIYIFLKGTGRVTLDGQNFDVKEGSCLRVAPSVKRMLENTGDEELQFICIHAKENSLGQFAMTDGVVG